MTEPRTAGLGLLLRLRLRLLQNRARALTASGWLKVAALALLTAAFLVGEGMVTHHLLRAIRSQEVLVDEISPLFVALLLESLLALVLLVCLSMLFFSNVTTSIATIYLSRDLDLLLATPAPANRVFALKLLETIVNSSYMAILFVVPILVAYGVAFTAGPAYYLQIPFTLTLFVLPPAAAGVLLTMLLMRYLPARRTHQALSTVGILLTISFITMLRVVGPERLLEPTSRADLGPERLLEPTSRADLDAILRALTFEAAEWLPSTWAAGVQMAMVEGDTARALEQAIPLAVSALLSIGLTLVLARSMYLRGVTASHEARRRARAPRTPIRRHLGLAARDLKLFIRDPAQWSQVLLLGALVVVYVFNITALPTNLMVIGAIVTLREIIAWINVGLAGFVLAATAMRFVLPTVSSEGEAFWLVASSPLSRRRYLLRKLTFYLPAMLSFSLILVALSGSALGVDRYTQLVSLGTTALVTATLTIMAIGIGAALPSFKMENPAQFVLTAGGILYGVLALIYVVAIVALEARPYFWHILGSAGVIDPSAVDPRPYWLAVVGLSVALAATCLTWGMRRVERLEA